MKSIQNEHCEGLRADPGGTGQGPSIASDGYGGYSGQKMQSLLALPMEERYEHGLPLTSAELDQLKVIDARLVEESVLPDDFVPDSSESRYQRMKEAHRREIKQLKLVLESAEAKEKEREWYIQFPYRIYHECNTCAG